ncbi:MAG: hypothetical protein IJE77_11875 [Thermoguttaceae bacterium]|nr:hypothetical protein [Thermoguttaceae bacterium]
MSDFSGCIVFAVAGVPVRDAFERFRLTDFSGCIVFAVASVPVRDAFERFDG